MRYAPVFLTMWVVSAGLPLHAGENWPQFRGGKLAGVVTGNHLPDTWSTTKNVVWKSEIPGRGWSSPVVWGDKIFLTSCVGSGEGGVPKTGYYAPRQVETPEGEFRWTVFCIDAQSGKILWERAAHQGRTEYTTHVKNSYASETPITDGERVYAYFGNVGLFCFDMSGKELWSKKWGVFPTNFGWGTGASPVLHQDRIYLVNDNEKQSFLVALDKKTGQEVWRVDRDEKTSWATPFVWENNLRTEVITSATTKVRSYDLSGKLLWELRGMSSICIPQPVTGHGLLFVSSGYEFARPRPVYAIRPGASGDISLQKGETSNQHIIWYKEPAGAYHPSPLVLDDHVYVLYSRGLIACFDAQTGKALYDNQRLGGNFTASPWSYDGKIFCLSEEGITYVIQAGPEFKILGKNDLEEMCLATPAIAKDSLYMRTFSKLYRLRNAKAGAASAPLPQDSRREPPQATHGTKDNAPSTLRKAERVFDEVFGDWVAVLKASGGCLGVDTAKTASGKQVCFAWFSDKHAAVKWLAGDEHRLFMKVNFPEVVKADRQPLKDVPDDCGPLMMITSITLTDKPVTKEKRLPLSQFAVEFYKPLKRGGYVGGGFAPATFAFRAGLKPTDPPPDKNEPALDKRPAGPVEPDGKTAPKTERVFDEVFDDLMAALKKHPGCLGSETFATASGQQAGCAWYEDKKSAVTWFSNDEHLRFMKANFPSAIKRVPLRDVADDCGPILTISSIIFKKKPDPKDKRLPLSQIAIELYTPLCRDSYVGGGFSPESVPFPLPKKAGKKPAAPQPAAPENCQAAADYSAKHGGLAVLVMLDGKTVFERYDNGHAADKLTHLHSATKGFWGSVVAAMIEDKLIASFDELACETLTEWNDDPRKRTITVRHLLQLNAGLAQDIVNLQGHDRPTLAPDLYKHAVGLTAVSDPGEQFVYGPSCYYALGELMRRKLAAKKQTPLDYLKARILDPIGVKVGKWVQDKSGNPHIPNGAYLTAGDWARYGQFLLQGGQWDGKQIVKRELLGELYQPSKANPGHGLAIWLNGPGGRGASPLQKAKAEAGFVYPAGVPDLVAALGAGKCRMYVIPSLKMVALRQCDSARDAYQDDVFLGLLLEGKSRTVSSPRIEEKEKPVPDKKSIEKKEGKEEPFQRPVGIFSVGLRRQPPPKELLEKPFVDGVTLAEGWVYVEPAESKYDFSTIEKALAAVEPFHKKLTICLFPFPVPDWLNKDPKVQTYKVPHAGPGFITPVPWDERGLTRWEALCKALSEHRVPDRAQGGKLVPLRDHPLLSAVHCWPMGMNGIRDIAMVSGRDTPLHKTPNYSREKLTRAILRSTHAMVDRFPRQFHCLPFFRIQDNTASPPLEQHLIGALKKEFWSGKGAPQAGLLQENLSAGGPNASGGSVLIQEKSDTYIMLQAIESWAKPTQGFAGAVRQGAPEDAIRRGYDIFDCRYFEIYMADLLHKDFEDGFKKWHTFLQRDGPMPAPAKKPFEGKVLADGNSGRLKSVDVEKNTITVTIGEKDQVFSVVGAKLLRPGGGEVPGGLKAVKTFLDRQALSVTLKIENKEGKEVVTEVRLQPAGTLDGKPGKSSEKPAKPKSRPANPSGPTVPQEGSLKPGDAAPDFTLKLLDDQEGRTVTLSKLNGRKPLVLIFGSFT